MGDAAMKAAEAGGAPVPVDGRPGTVRLAHGGCAEVRPLKRSRMTRIFAQAHRESGGSAEVEQMLVAELVTRHCVVALHGAKRPDGAALAAAFDRDGGELLLAAAAYDELDAADIRAIADEALRGVALTGAQAKN